MYPSSSRSEDSGESTSVPKSSEPLTTNLIDDSLEGLKYFCNCMANDIVGGLNFGEIAGVGGAGYYSYKAWKHAATTPSKTFGTPSLIYPMKSSVVRGYLRWGGKAVAAGIVADYTFSTLKCLYDEYKYFSP
jgi:hypothetical protein